jgi:hypothetical protein
MTRLETLSGRTWGTCGGELGVRHLQTAVHRRGRRKFSRVAADQALRERRGSGQQTGAPPHGARSLTSANRGEAAAVVMTLK